MKKVFIFIIYLLSFFSTVKCQDTFKIMQYNLLYYGTNTGFCNSTNNNVNTKNEYLRTIIGDVKPDIITVNEFGANTTLPASFVSNNLNIDGTYFWQYCRGNNNTGASIVNCVFYNSQKFFLVKHESAQTYVRDIDVFKFAVLSATTANDSTFLTCVVAHLKAGSSKEDEGKRKVMAQGTMSFLESYYANQNVLVMGDFNLYTAEEGAYTTFTDKTNYPKAYFVDPVADAGVGDWNNNYQFKDYHTQSTNATSSGCISSGGMDDRFDFILMSNTLAESDANLEYVDNSYEAFGNDGEHFNNSINAGTNYAVSKEVADALAGNSDHLPVTMLLRVKNTESLEEQLLEKEPLVLMPNPAQNNTTVLFTNDDESLVHLQLVDLTGRVIIEKYISSEIGNNKIELPLNNLQRGMYIVRLANSGKILTQKLIVE